jgi:hypothetical protein
MFSMIAIGLVYVAIGLAMHYTRNQNVKRTKMLFLMIGILNLLLAVLGALLPVVIPMLKMASNGSIVGFALLTLLEFNKDYRKFRDRSDEWERKFAELEEEEKRP